MDAKTNQKLLVPGKWHAELDKNGNFVNVVYDKSFRKLLGYESENEYANSQDIWINSLHPEDRNRVNNYMMEVTKKHSEGMDYDIEYRMKTKSGYHWFHDYAQCNRSEDGTLISFEGIVFDIQESMDKYATQAAHKSILENNTRILALEDKFESLYDIDLETGHYEIYIKGQTFGDVSTRLINKNDFFTDAITNIRTVVYEEDQESLLGILTCEYFRKALEKENHFDWYYRLVANNNLVWVRMRIIYKNADKRNVIVGVFNAEEEIAAKKKEEQLRGELVNRMVGEDGVFLIDCLRDKRKTIHDHCHGASFYSDKESFSESFSRYVNTFVAKADRDMMRKFASPMYILGTLKDKKEYSIEYRDTTTGIQRYYIMRIVKFSETDILQSFAEKDNEIINRLIFNKLKDDYFAFFSVDLDSGLIQVQKENFGYMMGNEGTVKPYSPIIKSFAASYTGETKEFFDKISDINYLKRRFAKEDKSTYTFKLRMIKGAKWINVTELVLSRHEDGTPSLFALGFSYADSLESTSKEAQEQIKEDMQMIGGLASEYHTLYYFNIDENFFKVYSIDGRKFPEAKKYVKKNEDPVKMLQEFGKSILVHPDDRHLFKEITIETARERLAHTKKFTVRFRRNYNGEYLWTEMDVIKYEDINERANIIALGFAERDKEIRREQMQALEQDLANQQRHIKAFGDMVNAALWSLDLNKNNEITAVSWTNEFRRMFGYKDEDDFPNVLESWTNLVHPEDKDYVLENFWNCLKNKSVEDFIYDVSYRILRKTGEYRWYHTIGRLEETSKDTRRIFGIITDISADKKLEEQQHQLETAYDAAQSANKSKTSFLFNMSHDIRTPMNAITGFATMAKKYVDDKAKVTDYLNKIEISGQQLLMLINQVLEMSRIESGKIEFETKPVNIQKNYESFVTVISEQAKSAGIEFHHSLTDIKHVNILADETRMNQITLNITGNAIKYTPRGGRIDFNFKENEHAKEGYASYTLTVSDTGIGMSEEFLKVIFEPFSREKSSTVSKIQGTGLGMSIVKNLVDMLGGSIEVQSELGKGSTFIVNLEFKLNEEKENEETSEHPVWSNNFKGHRVLLVEDNEFNREIARFILEDQGLIVEEAEDGDIAVEKIKSIVDNDKLGYYDFVLMDIQMPRMNGYEATRKIREIQVPEGQHLPIIAMTANAFEEDKQNAIAAGMDDHLAKPIDIKQLWTTISKFIT